LVHVAGEIISPGLVLGVVALVVGRDQVAEIGIGIGPVLDVAGDRAVGDIGDAPAEVPRIAEPHQRGGAVVRGNTGQKSALGVIGEEMDEMPRCRLFSTFTSSAAIPGVPNQGRGMNGRTPANAFIEGLPKSTPDKKEKSPPPKAPIQIAA
jgi:hypothetical protein